jgi:hypothetical protein
VTWRRRRLSQARVHFGQTCEDDCRSCGRREATRQEGELAVNAFARPPFTAYAARSRLRWRASEPARYACDLRRWRVHASRSCDARREPDDHELDEFHAVCLDCLIETHPEAGAGMDIARRAGSSRFHAGIWMEETQ